jgi:hypothetical protein
MQEISWLAKGLLFSQEKSCFVDIAVLVTDFVRVREETSIIFHYSINRFVFIMGSPRAFCEVESELLNRHYLS